MDLYCVITKFMT